MQPAPAEGEAGCLSVNELLLAFIRHAEQHYRRADGTVTNELTVCKAALRPLKELYGTLPVADFGPLKLKAVRQCRADMRCYFLRFKIKARDEETTPGRHVWEHAFRRTVLGRCQVCWQKTWRDAELLEEGQALSRGVINNPARRTFRKLHRGQRFSAYFRAIGTRAHLWKYCVNVRR